VSIEDLEEAVEVYRTAEGLVPRRAVARATFLTNLGDALLDRSAVHDLEGDPESGERTLREGVRALRRAVALTSPGAPYRSSRLAGLGVAQRWLAERTHDAADVAAARRSFREACRAGLSPAPEMTVAAAGNWIRWAVSRGAWAEVGEADDFLLEAAQSLQRAQIAIEHRQEWLRPLRGLAQESMYAAARRGRRSEAVVRLERARAVLLTEALDLAPRTVARLTPELRDRYLAAVTGVAAAQQAVAAAGPVTAD